MWEHSPQGHERDGPIQYSAHVYRELERLNIALWANVQLGLDGIDQGRRIVSNIDGTSSAWDVVGCETLHPN